jgi:hypothetical protein
VGGAELDDRSPRLSPLPPVPKQNAVIQSKGYILRLDSSSFTSTPLLSFNRAFLTWWRGNQRVTLRQ